MSRPPNPARQAARISGEKRYLSSRPCPRGHLARWVVGAGCVMCSAERHRRARERKRLLREALIAEACQSATHRRFPADALAKYRSSELSAEHSRYLDELIRKAELSRDE